MKTLLAIDGSENATEALRSLKYLSTDHLVVLHALNVPKPAYPMMVPEVAQELYHEVERSMHADGERLLERTVSLLPFHTGPIMKVIRAGSPAEVILTTAEEQGIELIVMGARGLGPIKERLVSVPIKTMQHVLLPLKGASDTEAAIGFLERKPFRQPVELTLLSVLPAISPSWGTAALAAESLQAGQKENAQLFLHSAANQLQRAGYTAKTHVVIGTPVESILEEAKKRQADLILMGSRGRQGVRRLVLGSVSHAVLHHPPCPILVFN
jgi:nucleotide-binding universal stress UspA family protein